MKTSEPDTRSLTGKIRDWLSTDIGRTLADGGGQNVVITDAAGLLVWANRSFIELSEFELKEIRGRSPGAFMQGPLTDPATVARISEALRAGRTVTEDILNYRKSGKPIWIRMRIDPIHADDGTMIGFIGLGFDLTARKLLESQLESSLDSRFEQAKAAAGLPFEASPLQPLFDPQAPPIVILTDLSGKVRHLSASGLSFFGYRQEDVVDRLNLLDLAIPLSYTEQLPSPLPSELEIEDSGLYAEMLSKLFSAGSVEPIEVLCRGGDSLPGKGLLISTPLGDNENYAAGYSVLLLGLDIAPNRATEYPLTTSPLHSRLNVSGTLVQFISQGKSVIWSYLPSKAAILLGINFEGPRPVGFRRILAAFHREERRRILIEFARPRENGQVLSITARLRQKQSAEPRWVRVTAAPEEYAENQVKWHALILDESALVRAELESRRKSELLELMVGVTTSFVDAHFDEIDRVIDEALARTGAFFGVDRAFVFEYDFVTKTTSNTHEWVSEGTEPFKDILQAVAMEGLEVWLDTHLAGKVINIPDVDRFPFEPMRKILQMQGIRSVMSVPLMANGTCVGFVGFDGVRKARAFTEGEIAVLQIFSKNIVGMIECRNISIEREGHRRRLLDVISAAGEFVWEIDDSRCLTYISDQSAPAFNRDPRTLIGAELTAFVPPPQQSLMKAWLDNLYSAPAPFVKKEYYVQLADGSLKIHHLSGTPILREDGTCAGFRGVGLDITHQRHLSQSLENAQTEIDTFFEVAVDLVLICDTAGKIVRLSKSWEKLMEMPLEDMLGENVLTFNPPEDVERTAQELESLKTKSRTIDFVNRWRTRTGRYVSLEWTAASHEGLYFACARDVSMRQEAQTMLRQALEIEKKSSEIKSKLIAMTSHEFRTPLASIRLAAEMLRNRIVSDDDDDAWMLGKTETIIAKTDFLESVVSDVLDLQSVREPQRLCRNDSTLRVERLSTIVGEVCTEFKTIKANLNRISLLFDDHYDTPVPRDPVRRILRNLIENALKYSPPHEPVVVQTLACALGIEVRVIDKGPGVAAGETDLIFKDFFRGENSLFVPGTGLGLSIAMEAAQRLEGFVSYQRKWGGPTIFTLQFPVP